VTTVVVVVGAKDIVATVGCLPCEKGVEAVVDEVDEEDEAEFEVLDGLFDFLRGIEADTGVEGEERKTSEEILLVSSLKFGKVLFILFFIILRILLLLVSR